MTEVLTSIAGISTFVVAQDGPELKDSRDITDMLANAAYQGADMMIIPVARLTADFLDLKTKIAGEMLQKFVNYKVRCVIMGNIADRVAKSKALHDFVYECNQGRHINVVLDELELEAQLAREAA